jgi:hypothetical protein
MDDLGTILELLIPLYLLISKCMYIRLFDHGYIVDIVSYIFQSYYLFGIFPLCKEQ